MLAIALLFLLLDRQSFDYHLLVSSSSIMSMNHMPYQARGE